MAPGPALPAGLPSPPRAGRGPLPRSVGPEEAYAGLRRHLMSLLKDWEGMDLEARVAFAEKRGTRLRRVEAALILISNLPESAGPGDFGPLAASLKTGELSILSGDLDSEGYALSAYGERMVGKEA